MKGGCSVVEPYTAAVTPDRAEYFLRAVDQVKIAGEPARGTCT